MGNASKKRIFQVARELNVSHEALISHLKKLDYDISSRMSVLTDEMYEEAVKRFGAGDVAAVGDEQDFKRQLRDKRAREEARKLEAQREYEEKVRASYMIMSETPRVRKARTKAESIDIDDTGSEFADEIEEREHAPKPKAPKRGKTPKKAVTTQEEDAASVEAEKAVEELVKPVKKEEVVAETDQVDKDIKEEVGPKEAELEPEKAKLIKRSIEKAKTEPVEATDAKKGKDEKAKDRDIDLKVIRKVEADKEAKTEKAAEDDDGKKKARKKLKAKDRISESKKGVEKSEDESASKKRRKKKKQEVAEDTVEGGAKKTKSRKKSKKRKKIQINEEEVERSIRETLSAMEDSGRGKKRYKKIKAEDDDELIDDNVLRVHEFASVGEIANEMDVEPSLVIKKCLELGMLVSINQRLDEDMIVMVADEFGFEVEIIPEFGTEKFEEIEDRDDESLAVYRPPVVTIMGHVDHGKTSLLDFIRKSNIIEGESGGITQHIGAYSVNIRDKIITFLDTPGHEAFAAMRARGAQATDIVVLIVAADDNVMPQTIEAISHARAAGVPIVVAINKIDKPNANPDSIKKQLAEQDLLIESWGGKYQSVDISAKTGENVDKLLDSILIEAEMLELKANPDRLARGVVIESELDKGKGVLATVLVQKGSLRVGDPFISGQFSGKVRNLYNDKGQKVDVAGPSLPVQVMGFSGLPQAGDTFIVLESEKDTKEISARRQQVKREQEFRRTKHMTLDEISRRIREGQVKELSIIVKGDVDGSVEALSDTLRKLSNDEVAVKIILKGVGAVSESDVLLASTSDAIIIGFQVRPTIKAREVASREKVDIRLYSVIYDAISDVKDALEGLLEPEFEEKNLSVTEIREIFRVPKIGVVAGCYVVSGKVTRNDLAKLFRDDKLIFEGKIGTLKRFKEDAKEVAGGFECGMTMAGYDDYKVGDIIETYKLLEIKRTLASVKS
ncbi:translation initiation factor IF-2 [candidate division KSB1 bacterium]|nr:translation initiation factor IF-2 [candidate division KSB1 bacterium]